MLCEAAWRLRSRPASHRWLTSCSVLKTYILSRAEYCECAVELLRENKRMLDKAIRDLDRERMGLQNQEKKLVAEIKKTAKQGQMVRPLQC